MVEENSRADSFKMERLLIALLLTVLCACHYILAASIPEEFEQVSMTGLRRCTLRYCCPLDYRCGPGLTCVDGKKSIAAMRCFFNG